MYIRPLLVSSMVVAILALLFSLFFAEALLDHPLVLRVATDLYRAAEALEPPFGVPRGGYEMMVGNGRAWTTQSFTTASRFSDIESYYESQFVLNGWTRTGSTGSSYVKGQLCARVLPFEQSGYSVEYGWRVAWCNPGDPTQQSYAVAIGLAGLSQLGLVYWTTKGLRATQVAEPPEEQDIELDHRREERGYQRRQGGARITRGYVSVAILGIVSLAAFMLSVVSIAVNFAAYQN